MNCEHCGCLSATALAQLSPSNDSSRIFPHFIQENSGLLSLIRTARGAAKAVPDRIPKPALLAFSPDYVEKRSARIGAFPHPAVKRPGGDPGVGIEAELSPERSPFELEVLANLVAGFLP